MLSVTLPFTDPIKIFATILGLILLAPIFIRKVKLPGIVGLIFAGMLVGPHVLNLLSEEIGFNIFGTFGLLYLMFLAGLEIDFRDFKRNRKKTAFFGFLSFTLPMLLGFLFAFFYLNESVLASLLVGGMLSSHTLVSYSIIGKYSIKQHPVLTVIVGGTIIADTLALLLLGLVSDLTVGDNSLWFWLRTVAYYTLFFIYISILVPRVSKWFFIHFQSESTIEYIFVLVVVFVSSLVAELLTIEPIIGAFFAGLALNRLILRTSPLMNRIVFSGESLFIPFFLISVGMLVNPGALFVSAKQLVFASAFVVIALVSKWIPAWVFQLSTKNTSKSARGLIFGLTTSRAASAIAIVLVGYNIGLLNEAYVNATVMLILVTCIVSSVLVENKAREIAISELDNIKPIQEHSERIIVPVSNPETMEHLVHFALLVKNPKSDEPVYPLSIVPDDDTATENIRKNNRLLEKANEHAASMDKKVQILTRVDLNITNGISRVVKEMDASKIIMGWNDKVSTVNYFFGTLLENLLMKSNKMLFVLRTPGSLRGIKRLVIITPATFEYETGFAESILFIHRLQKQLGTDLLFLGNQATHYQLKKEYLNLFNENIDAGFQEYKVNELYSDLQLESSNDDLLIFFKARKRTISYYKVMEQLPDMISKRFANNNVVIVYPEQETLKFEGYILQQS